MLQYPPDIPIPAPIETTHFFFFFKQNVIRTDCQPGLHSGAFTPFNTAALLALMLRSMQLAPATAWLSVM